MSVPRLVRGERVVIADSFGQPRLRGKTMIVASKGLVKCNRNGRCAGDWCAGYSVFVALPESNNEDREMGWRGGTNKICLTHLRGATGELLLPPPAVRGPISVAPVNKELISWQDLENAALDPVALLRLAMQLKAENSILRGRIEQSDRSMTGMGMEHNNEGMRSLQSG